MECQPSTSLPFKREAKDEDFGSDQVDEKVCKEAELEQGEAAPISKKIMSYPLFSNQLKVDTSLSSMIDAETASEHLSEGIAASGWTRPEGVDSQANELTQSQIEDPKSSPDLFLSPPTTSRFAACDWSSMPFQVNNHYDDALLCDQQERSHSDPNRHMASCRDGCEERLFLQQSSGHCPSFGIPATRAYSRWDNKTYLDLSQSYIDVFTPTFQYVSRTEDSLMDHRRMVATMQESMRNDCAAASNLSLLTPDLVAQIFPPRSSTAAFRLPTQPSQSVSVPSSTVESLPETGGKRRGKSKLCSKGRKDGDETLSDGCVPNPRWSAAISPSAKKVLFNWFMVHHLYPYPDRKEKERLSEHTGLAVNKISNWFCAARKKYRNANPDNAIAYRKSGAPTEYADPSNPTPGPSSGDVTFPFSPPNFYAGDFGNRACVSPFAVQSQFQSFLPTPQFVRGFPEQFAQPPPAHQYVPTLNALHVYSNQSLQDGSKSNGLEIPDEPECLVKKG